MKKLFFLGLFIMVLTGCSEQETLIQPSSPAPEIRTPVMTPPTVQTTVLLPIVVATAEAQKTVTSENTSVSVANPASVNCQEKGGTLSIITAPDGQQWGLCEFTDGSICEEWKFFRGECQKGVCKKECKAIGTRSEGWYDSCSGELITWSDCG